MLPSALSARTGVYWDILGSSALLDTTPGFGNLGKSFLIENLLRAGDSPQGLPAPPPLAPTVAAATDTTVEILEHPFSSSPVTFTLCPGAEQIGSPYQTHWAFQVLNPSTDSSQQSGPTQGNQGGALQLAVPASSKLFFLRAPQFYSTCCGGSCQHPVSPTALPREDTMLPLLTQDSNSKAQRGILRRAVFSDDQRKSLEKMFQKQKYINKTDRKKLSINLGLKESQVKIWFQNRRMKWRNCKEKEVLYNQYIKEEGLQENQISRSTLGFTSSCPRIWKVSQQHSSSRWRDNLAEPSERLNHEDSLQLLPQANSYHSLYFNSEADTRDKGITSAI
ncbi:homeobox protein DBX2 isoform X1 [Dromiciops gliroides]|uniref:homeobox protein DBX2 isoform X1 n=1 Tax=Dromiciops gliroides TaxID=33562 RepID=UPI001CC7B818|nr:homeobox protein DBX2 isoform X1 [Dromiciops gliroides]